MNERREVPARLRAILYGVPFWVLGGISSGFGVWTAWSTIVEWIALNAPQYQSPLEAHFIEEFASLLFTGSAPMYEAGLKLQGVQSLGPAIFFYSGIFVMIVGVLYFVRTKSELHCAFCKQWSRPRLHGGEVLCPSCGRIQGSASGPQHFR